ncbi:MAG: hypothetical protein HY535_05440 [Chloroflexi bacterium]|nr:hypothetical protein [Chloroflexota bacterium]
MHYAERKPAGCAIALPLNVRWVRIDTPSNFSEAAAASAKGQYSKKT